jgi:acyl-CoA thioesterase
MPGVSDEPRRQQLDGLSYIRAVRDGSLEADPLMRTLGIRVVEAERGRVVMEATPDEDHLNLGGAIHGGYLSTLMDSVTGYALHTTLAPAQTPPHLAASYRFLTYGRPGIALRATGEVLKSGRTVGHVRTEIHDADGRLIATGETTHAVAGTGADNRLRPGPST